MTGFGLEGFGLATRDFFDLFDFRHDLCLYPIFVESIAQCASGETEEFGRPNLVSAGEGKGLLDEVFVEIVEYDAFGRKGKYAFTVFCFSGGR